MWAAVLSRAGFSLPASFHACVSCGQSLSVLARGARWVVDLYHFPLSISQVNWPVGTECVSNPRDTALQAFAFTSCHSNCQSCLVTLGAVGFYDIEGQPDKWLEDWLQIFNQQIGLLNHVLKCGVLWNYINCVCSLQKKNEKMNKLKMLQLLSFSNGFLWDVHKHTNKCAYLR